MPNGHASTPQIVASAEEWGERYAAFLTAVYNRWQADRGWPNLDDLGRQGLREQWGFDAFELAENIPAPLGQYHRGAEDRVVLRVRGLRFVPAARQLLNDFVRAVRLGAELYVEETGKPQLQSTQLAETLELDARRMADVSELLFIEGWMLGSGGGDHAAEWQRELWRSYRFLVGIEDLEGYLQAEAEQLWAQPRSTGIPLLEGPIETELLLRPVGPSSPEGGSPPEVGTPADPTPSDERAGESANGIPSVFISYAHEDKPLAEALADGLEKRRLKVWIDEKELLAGDSIIERISKAVADVDFFCALVSEASRESRWCQHELNLAMTKGVREGATVIPVRVGDVEMPESILDKLYVQLDPSDVDPAVERIARDVRRHRQRRIELGDKAVTQVETRPEPGPAEGSPGDDAHQAAPSEQIVRDLNTHVEVAARDLLNRDDEVTAEEVREWAGSTGVTIRVYCGDAWELRFLAEGRGRGLSPRDELNTKIHFIHDDLVLKARGGHFS